VSYSSREDNASSGNPNGKSFNEHQTEASSLTSLRPTRTSATPPTARLAIPAGLAFIGDYAGNTSLDQNFDTFPVWTDLSQWVPQCPHAGSVLRGLYEVPQPRFAGLGLPHERLVVHRLLELQHGPDDRNRAPTSGKSSVCARAAMVRRSTDDTLLAPNRILQHLAGDELVLPVTQRLRCGQRQLWPRSEYGLLPPGPQLLFSRRLVLDRVDAGSHRARHLVRREHGLL